MTNEEVLLALSNMLEPIREDIQEIKGDVQILKGDVEELKGDVQILKEDFIRLEENMEEVKVRVRKIELNQENVILPRLQTIESCYTSTYDRYKESVEDYEIIKQDVSLLKGIAEEHSKQIQKIS